MDEASYKELKLIKSVLPIRGSTVIIARFGLHYWASNILDEMVGTEADVHKNWWGKIDHIYYLIQKNDIKPFGPAGLYGPPYPEPERPSNSHLIFDGGIFQLFSALSPPDKMSD